VQFSLHATFIRFCLSISAMLLANYSLAGADLPTLKVGVLEFGTVRWELDVIERHKLASEHGFELQVVPLASNQATLTALQSGAVDMIVGDWIWAARQREFQRNYQVFPYSSEAASVMVAKDSAIISFADLQGKTIGIAGGPVNKSWILYKAYAKKVYNLDLEQDAHIKFAAPPILNELMLKGELDAVINFWHFSARLKERGLVELVSMDEVLAAFDLDSSIPVLGWLFKSQWAKSHAELLESFLSASFAARELMQQQDNEWLKIAALQNIESPALRTLLRDDYRKGIPQHFGAAEINATNQLFDLLRAAGGKEFSGALTQLPDDLFWKSSVLPTR